MHTTTVIRATALAAVLTAAPLAFSPGTGIRQNAACAQTEVDSGAGCCKQETGSICNNGSSDKMNYYYTTKC
jgi:hypothetical protein